MVGQQPRTLRFGYPRFYRWFFGAATLTFVLLFALSVTHDHDDTGLMVVALLLSFALVSLYTYWRSWTRVLVGERELTLTRPGLSTRIYYRDITRVRHLAPEHSLVIEGRGRRIYVKKQLQGYGRFYRAVYPRFPLSSFEYRRYLPLDVHTCDWVLFRPWLLVASGLSFVGLARFGLLPENVLWAAVALVVGALLLAAGLYTAWRLPRVYRFSRDQLTVSGLLWTRVYPVTELRSMDLVTHSDDPREMTCLRLVFRKGEVRLRDQAVDYAPEALAWALRRHYVPQTGGQ